ncbi:MULTISPECIES: HK97 gp10 family phage protein [unclassified Roseobacter]|uniref:HK97 gp10 family phage protein n=2 Tax=unclassified Roseobacter TaxID=196798 RepID=UPI0014928563|nr:MULTISPECIES: HK97 gp10 family phage protein [unclassified Roseobacter]NNV11942.1 HK97 gp10 family phage protein [Roseobacter sp. HKCCD7357]NNV38963.1 HK97 gp10 family phage protein [Roseobacter sp. HKCCD9054]NNV43674.1 HK97 gp10 family phage protein [Roseobacter sp. HKCCD6497]NNV94541.1 HK97 gp10 family phage protein [Roseobacter sp. HKCCD8914]NNW19861.1 HK97 gp10 family phage protein [Roseobacter sp. HKCCD7543]NNW62513.1 HK97 gp10 family phage protein [Roseobacter sp. HKCCD8268]NNW75274
MSGQFTATLERWSDKAIRNFVLVRNQSAQDVIEIMQRPVAQGGRMRVKTGFLRNSLVVSTDEMATINPNAKPGSGQEYSFSIGEASSTILGASMNDTIYAGYTAAYAAAREYGARGQGPDFYVRGAAQEWPDVVARNARRLRD